MDIAKYRAMLENTQISFERLWARQLYILGTRI